jgi:membrane protein
VSATDGGAGAGRLRVLASQVAERIGGLPAARTFIAVMAVYDDAGGGLVAGGLAFAALFALLPGLLLVLSVVGLLAGDAAVREQLVGSIAAAAPPLESLARLALDQVAVGAVPTGVVAILGLLWGSSRFYGTLDRAFAGIFDDAPRRNEVQRTLRGLALSAAVVALPAVALVAGWVASRLLDVAPAGGAVGAVARAAWAVASPIALVILFVLGTGLVYRVVPAARIPRSARRLPSAVAGLALAAFTQAFTLVAPRLVGAAALYGTFVAIIALLAWLSIGFNVLMLGAAWTRVRTLRPPPPASPEAADPAPGHAAGAPDEAGDPAAA